MSEAPNWHFGNAAIDGADRRGWLVGHFMEPDDIRMFQDVEIKWGIHPAGEEREAWHDEEHRTTVLLLISGRFRINLAVGMHVLSAQGDYALLGPGIGHSWQAEEDSIVVTIRWPDVPSVAATSTGKPRNGRPALRGHEPQHVLARQLQRRLGHHREEQPQLRHRRQQRVGSSTRLDELQIPVQQRITQPQPSRRAESEICQQTPKAPFSQAVRPGDEQPRA